MRYIESFKEQLSDIFFYFKQPKKLKKDLSNNHTLEVGICRWSAEKVFLKILLLESRF